MSTLEVSNLNDGTTTVATTFVTNGSAKAWCRFDGTGTIAITSSLNTASLTDVGTGDHTINLTTALDANDGAHLFSSSNFHSGRSASGSASTIRVFVANNSHALSDNNFVVGATFGDLA